MKKGDAIAVIAQPVAKTIDWVWGTNLQGCAGCKQMQSDLNEGMNFLDAVTKRMKGYGNDTTSSDDHSA